MVRNTNTYHPNFIKYMDKIIHHPNYAGLPIRFKKNGSPVWVAPKKSKDGIGTRRIDWANKKAIELGFETSSKKYADTMFAIHPTKRKVCQLCGETMDLHYIYPTKNTIRFFEKEFGYVFNRYDSIYDVILQIPKYEEEIREYLIKKADLPEIYKNKTTSKIIQTVEYKCRMGGKNIFSPGAMSNFPDRFDGFHSYNLCCRKLKDKGRHDANMATYNKDRRAYEYWSDGNIAAANQLMRDPSVFSGLSADHIGPISLGFIHDPYYLQPMSSSDNSSKRDRLYEDDMQKLITIENKTNISPVSFFARNIWEFIKNDYQSENRIFSLEWYRDILKQNMLNFMESVWILLNTDDRLVIENFFKVNYFQPKYEKFFGYRYIFNPDGTIKETKKRNLTAATEKEFSRFVRISLESVYDFHDKSIENRNNKSSISNVEISTLKIIQNAILTKKYTDSTIFNMWTVYIEDMQDELLKDWTE